MKYTKIILASVQVLVTAGIFFLIFSEIKFSSVLKCFRQADAKYLLCVPVLLSLNHYFPLVFKYGNILETAGCKIPVAVARILKLGAMPLAVILPFKTGKALRLVFLKNLGISYKKGLISVLLEFFFAAASLCSVIFFGIKIWAGALFLLAVFLVSKSFKGSFSAFCWSTVYEIARIFCVFLVFLSFGVNPSFEDVLVKIPVMLFIAGLPVTVSGFGAREMSALFLFSLISSREKIVSAMLTVSFFEFLVPSVVGLIFVKKFLKGMMKR